MPSHCIVPMLRRNHPFTLFLARCSAALIARLGVGWWQRVTIGGRSWVVRGEGCSSSSSTVVAEQGAPRRKGIIAVCPSVTVMRLCDGVMGRVHDLVGAFRISPCMGISLEWTRKSTVGRMRMSISLRDEACLQPPRT